MAFIRLQDRVKRLATHDFAPEFSARIRRWFLNPLGILASAAMVALLCGLTLHEQGYILFAGIMIVMTLGILWPWVSLRGLSGRLSFAVPRLVEGEQTEVSMILTNHFPWPAWGLALRGGLGGADNEAIAGVDSVPRLSQTVCRWSFSPSRRGVYPLMLPRLTTGFPFGLAEKSRSVRVEGTLTVWPRVYPVGPIPPVTGDHQVEGNVSRNQVGTHGDVLGVRPYRTGDSPRRIHWRQSAKHDRLIVCELQSNSRPLIQIVLDAHPSVHTTTGRESSREWAIRIVASLAKGWLEAGAQVGLTVGSVEIPCLSGPSQVIAILDALAALPDDSPRTLGQLLTCPHCRGFREGLQVIVTTDRTHEHDECAVCLEQHQRWIVLETAAFEGEATSDRRAFGHCPDPWLRIGSVDQIPALLKGGWREAKHGS
jgi:uncharacterized protein (DUF58 family)